ncbi:hypothetical protein AVO42_00475 [Thiomicrospira sp. XS5]|uniref:hypothetical protein n=1 Tax=Thiomicrospira sp. XS5 TaxID=1775636 RepID=UPI0007489C29|nr:hypothetical protein [Thiomicrospira sp. XS5]KUJ73931.1 hypothetical protein AVO42_00475 [Thiomicrospira sp. XS5]
MAVKLNVNRTQWIDVPVPVEGDKFETFKCEMRILRDDETETELKIVDLIVGVRDLEIIAENGKPLSDADMIDVIKRDHQLSQLVASAWNLGNQNIVKQQRTLLQPPDRSAK